MVRVFTIEQHYLRIMRQGNHFFSRQILHEQSKEQHEQVTTRNDEIEKEQSYALSEKGAVV